MSPAQLNSEFVKFYHILQVIQGFQVDGNAVFEAGGVLVSDEIKLSAEVQFVKQV